MMLVHHRAAEPFRGATGSGSNGNPGCRNDDDDDSNRSTTTQLANLPPELLFHIVDCVVPANPSILMPASHTSTKTLLSLMRASRATYAQASKLLRQRCVYVDSSRKLARLLLCMPGMAASPTLPPTLSLRHVTSLFLAPFGPSLDDLPTAEWVRELLCSVAEALRRLVIQMPFSSLDALDDHLNVRRSLRDGFERLIHLEEFICLEEFPALSSPDSHPNGNIWHSWPKLRRMVLFNPPLGNHRLWWDIATLSSLQHVVLATPRNLDSTNIKEEYFDQLPRDDPRLARLMRLVLLDAAYAIHGVATARWPAIDPDGVLSVETYEVPMPFYGDETPHELVTSWVKRGALDGSLWEWTGDKVG